jgi:hypothetical protein
MLPFTKRPGRGDESGNNDVLTKDDIVMPAPAASKRNAAPSSSPTGIALPPRGKFASVNDEEMTTLMSTKALGEARPSPRPAAGAPPPSRSAPPARGSSTSAASRSGNFAAMEEDEDGRTVVRGAPKIVKRSPNSAAKMGMPTSPTTISPSAVIKATLESARAGAKPKTDHLMAGPPVDLLEDLADRHPADAGPEHTAILASPSQPPPGMLQGVKALSTQMLQPQAMPHGTIPPGSARPMSAPPPAMSQSGGYPSTQSGGYAAQSGGYPSTQSGGYAAQSGGYPSMQSGGYAAQYNGPVPSGSVSVPGVVMPPPSMPAHFMVPQAPYSDARIDPPGTAVTARTRVAGRPASSWALALAAFGIFVGVGAVAVMNGNDNAGLMETSASFVDPSRAGAAKAAAAVQAPPAAVAPTGVPVAAADQAATPAPVAVPMAAPASTEAPAVAVAAAPAVAVAPVVPAAPAVAVAVPVVAAPPAAPAATVAAAPAPKPVAAPRPAPVSRPARTQADEPVAAAPKAAPKPAAKSSSKGSGDSAVDEEQRKALKALQESQLETPF